MATNRTFAKVLAGGLVLAGLALSVPALAQRDPAYQAARSSGQVGEKPDGYLGVVGSQSAAVQSMVSDLNIRRRENYAQKAQEQGVTLQEYAITQGCILIGRTEAGEKYQAPDGSWQTRGAGAPMRDARCP
ncbi:MAG TPA: YdbL family protein [Croceibacterium sp.]